VVLVLASTAIAGCGKLLAWNGVCLTSIGVWIIHDECARQELWKKVVFARDVKACVASEVNRQRWFCPC
jgi:hypothetical protein